MLLIPKTLSFLRSGQGIFFWRIARKANTCTSVKKKKNLINDLQKWLLIRGLWSHPWHLWDIWQCMEILLAITAGGEERADVIDTEWVESRRLVDILHCRGKPLPTKNQPIQDVSSTKDEKPWFTPISFKRQFHWFGGFIQRSLEPSLVIGVVHQAEKYHSWIEMRDAYRIMGLISYIKISNMESKKGFKQYQHSYIDSFIH